ncbi:MAG TPA: hypothetical protein VFR10_00575, partial [bacterium]|nr:hypothetical protein [bacterium]
MKLLGFSSRLRRPTQAAVAVLCIQAFFAPASAEVYLVNPQGTGDFPDLETALEKVVDGDIIELADGTYSRFTGFDFLGKAITVRSQSGIAE